MERMPCNELVLVLRQGVEQMIDTKAARDLTVNVMSDDTVGDEKKTVRLLGLISDAMCDVIDELRLIRVAGERETIPPPCPECQGIQSHLPRCRHFEPHYSGARDIPQVMEVWRESLDDVLTRPLKPWQTRLMDAKPGGAFLQQVWETDPRAGKERRASKRSSADRRNKAFSSLHQSVRAAAVGREADERTGQRRKKRTMGMRGDKRGPDRREPNG